MTRHLTLDDLEVTALLENVYRHGAKHYFKIGQNGEHFLYPLRKHLMTLGIPKLEATALMAAADIPYHKYIRKEKPKKPQPVELTEEEIARRIEVEKQKAKKLKAEKAAVAKRYSFVTTGSYTGIYDNENCTQELFHEESEARAYLHELVYGRATFREYYAAIVQNHHAAQEEEI